MHWLYWNSRTWSSSDAIVIFKWCHHVKLHLSILGTSGSLFKKKQWWARKRIHYSCEGRIENSVPRDHRLSSLGKPRDAKQWSSGRIFLSYPHTHDRSLYSAAFHPGFHCLQMYPFSSFQSTTGLFKVSDIIRAFVYNFFWNQCRSRSAFWMQDSTLHIKNKITSLDNWKQKLIRTKNV